jgi:hypothetical protein
MAHASCVPGSSWEPPASVPQESLQRQLAAFNRTRLVPDWRDGGDLRARLRTEYAHRLLEADFLARERATVRERAAQAPQSPDAFVAWFQALEQEGPGQNDPLFPWLAEQAPISAMRWFLRQEMAGEAGFDDLVALTQVRLPEGPKLELARNYWDEMGQGHAGGMHGPLLQRLGRELQIEGPADGSDSVWESLALGNLMLALALNRNSTYQSVGALGAIELTAPGRAEKVNAGLKRLGVAGAARRYFALHATLDRKHSASWNAEVLHALVAEEPALAQPLAEGALVRLRAGARCFDRYRRELGLTPRAVEGRQG